MPRRSRAFALGLPRRRWRAHPGLLVVLVAATACSGAASSSPEAEAGANAQRDPATAGRSVPAEVDAPAGVDANPPTPPPADHTLVPASTARVAAGGLRLRESPWASAPVLLTLEAGALVSIVGGGVSPTADGYAWHQVQSGEATGWVANDPADAWIVPEPDGSAPAVVVRLEERTDVPEYSPPTVTVYDDGVVIFPDGGRRLTDAGLARVEAMIDEVGLLEVDGSFAPADPQPFGHLLAVFTRRESGETIEVRAVSQGAQFDSGEVTALLDLADRLRRLEQLLPADAWLD